MVIYGLRRAAQDGEQKYGSDLRHFVERHFYVEDGLISLPTEAEAIDLLKCTQASLAESATHISKGKLTPERFQRFSTWESSQRAVSFLVYQTRSYRSDLSDKCKGWHKCNIPRTPEELAAARLAILKSVQRNAYPEEYAALQEKRAISRSSAILDLDPFMCDGLLQTGGRLRHASIAPEVKNSIILPKQSHVTKLLVSHYHTKVEHQGRQFTEGAVRAAGLWIVAGKRPRFSPPSLCHLP